MSPRPIRRATSADLGAIAALYDQMNAEHLAALPEMFRHTSASWRAPEFWSATLLEPRTALFVAESDDTHVVGYALVVVQDARDVPHARPRCFGLVHDLVVDQAHRRMGHGKRLLESAADAARQLGATSVELWVWDFNEGALALYERSGFRGLDRRLSKPL